MKTQVCAATATTRRQHLELTVINAVVDGYGDEQLRYLLDRNVAINLDTMILAAVYGDATTLQLLIQNGGDVRGTNRFGFSCLSAASLGCEPQHEVFDLLLRSGAAIDIPQTHDAFGSRESAIHWLCSLHRSIDEGERCQLRRCLRLLIQSGGNINYRIRHPGSTSEFNEAHERFLWSEPSRRQKRIDVFAEAKAETPLEYALIAGNEDTALELINWGCQLIGREIKLAVRLGLPSVLEKLWKHVRWNSNRETLRTTCLRLALRWGHERIVQFLLDDGVRLGEHDITDALQYPGASALSPRMQIDLIHATPDLDQRRIFGLPLLEVCCLSFSAAAIGEILSLYPAAYSSGALAATVVRALMGGSDFLPMDIEAMKRRRTETNCEWEKENMALLTASMFERPDILRALVIPGSVRAIKTACLSKDIFSWILDQRHGANPFAKVDPAYILGCHDGIVCSPLIGIATTRPSLAMQSVSEDMLSHFLACSYQPDALTVLVAATRGNLHLLRRFQQLENWHSILSIDNHDRLPWCPTALQVAVLSENEEMVQFLVDAGVSVNERPACQPLGGRMPRTALQAAIEKKNQRLTELFIEHGADVNAPAAKDSGATALQLACIHGDLDLSLRLLELGADVDASGAIRRGRTAIQGAAEHGRIDTIQLLLNYGACTDGPHRLQYVKAVVYAENNQHFAAAGLLREHREWSAEDEECYKTIQADRLCDD